MTNRGTCSLPYDGSAGILAAKEMEKKVREILEQLPERDRRLLREVFLEERDKDEVCRGFGVDREYLRVLLHRAKQAFKSLYKKNTGNDSPEFTPAEGLQRRSRRLAVVREDTRGKNGPRCGGSSKNDGKVPARRTRSRDPGRI